MQVWEVFIDLRRNRGDLNVYRQIHTSCRSELKLIEALSIRQLMNDTVRWANHLYMDITLEHFEQQRQTKRILSYFMWDKSI